MLFRSILEKWEQILLTVKEEHELSDVAFDTWLKPLQVYTLDGNRLYILIPLEQTMLNYITKKYTLPIKVVIAELTGRDLEIIFIIQEQTKNIPAYRSKDPKFMDNADLRGLNANYTFESFVVGKNNRFAHSASLAVAESPGDVYNPL